MFEVEKTFSFEAGHVLENHDAECASPHGHSYVMKIVIRRENLVKEGPKKGMVVDFKDIGATVKPMIDKYFDHRWLNDTLQVSNPTAEFIAKWVFEHLEKKIEGLYSISIYETPRSRATYFHS
jgi:6-pyruvoyltetrahydropterin/6-carboxytetrahydropterin synthase